jgi:hypothetical protein
LQNGIEGNHAHYGERGGELAYGMFRLTFGGLQMHDGHIPRQDIEAIILKPHPNKVGYKRVFVQQRGKRNLSFVYLLPNTVAFEMLTLLDYQNGTHFVQAEEERLLFDSHHMYGNQQRRSRILVGGAIALFIGLMIA